MRKSGWLKISLSAKCQFLFGIAVLLILAATLYLPWHYMSGLAQSAEMRLAEQIAVSARLAANLDYQDWQRGESQLARDWPATVRAVKLPNVVPKLIPADDEHSLRRDARGDFILESFRKFRENSKLTYSYKFQESGPERSLRLAMAVRAPESDPQPNRLRGIIHVDMPMIDENFQWSSIVVVLAGLSGCVLAMLVFYLVTQRLILSPVRELRGVAEQVTDGDVNVQANITTGDEFEELADAFNDMLARIKESHDELRTINRSLDVKLGELAETNVSLYESNKLKSEFIANVSHELRTPLGLIINFAELLKEALEDPPEDTERLVRYSVNILKSGRSLLEIINDLLDLAKIEAGRVELHITEFSMVETCRALLDFVRPLAEKKRLTLIGPAEDGLPLIHSDSGKVRQILYNLLSNAIKFTPEGGSVRFDVGSDDGRCVWTSVTDTGSGIAEDQFELIFQKFRQIDSSLTREHGGTGLGLAITRELVGVLGGSIEVHSELGQGSRFTIRLPVAAPEPKERTLVRLND